MDKFPYLGSTINRQRNFDDEITSRVQKVAVAFAALKLATNVSVYNGCILTSCLFAKYRSHSVMIQVLEPR